MGEADKRAWGARHAPGANISNGFAGLFRRPAATAGPARAARKLLAFFAANAYYQVSHQPFVAMTTQPHSAHSGLPAGVTARPPATRTPQQKAQAKALKQERKRERLRFFYAWCEGCQAFGAAF